MGQPARLAEEQLRALDRLSKRPEIDRFYLAGETAVAIHLGHRRSFDLDFFSVSGDSDALCSSPTCVSSSPRRISVIASGVGSHRAPDRVLLGER